MNTAQFDILKKWDITTFIEKYVDVAAALVLLAILCLIVLPMPAFVLDLAIALNFAFSLLLIAVAIYIKSILDMSSFPSLLLLTTLFRLGLSVATTKGVLLHAHAGDMVQAFGMLVVGSNVVVGLVIFLLLCAVQMVVVAKGSDRVAEVAARFTLDAIPGKQMSIDADLRAGSINGEQAKARRDILQREIQLHGALDGAMKFVKGDAMIGLIVAAINIVGGIAVGVLQKGFSFGQAVNTYVILTVGDGLVSQIPSLMVAIAAGLIITRGDAGGEGDNGDNLGRRIYDQVTTHPRSVLMAAAAAIILAAVPGFPHIQFIVIALALLGIGMTRRQRERTVARSKQAPMSNMARDGSTYLPNLLDTVEFGTTMPLRVRIGRQAFYAIVPADLNNELGNARRYLMQNLGLPFPGLSMVGETGFPEESFTIEVNDVNAVSGQLFAGACLAHGEPEALAGSSHDRPGFFPGSTEAYWLDYADVNAARDNGAQIATPAEVLSAQIYAVCYRHAADFMGTQEAQFLLTRLKLVFPELVNALLAAITPIAFGKLLAALLEESISIRNLRGICEAVVKMPTGDRSNHRLLEAARIAIVPLSIFSYVDANTNKLQVIVLDESWGTLLTNALRTDNEGEPCLMLGYRDVQVLQGKLKEVLQGAPSSAVLLTSSSLRKHVSKFLKSMGEQRTVIAIEEIPAGRVEIERVAVIGRNVD
ncbi:flagellar biosynthesis protein FlhA [Dyella nitratireducens]|uniref:EscV/YscV/HrcV family type III secretion system export apparatus protein n=1 Tax=Dyella nitratireducens TaxID=1849580 RepID=A0ABQ1FPS4_9GAMM|nr:flagellar biosynthesis protein FlhA [Dyella nitratireducens]GGA23396.1 EscV/YscV/HrcV family type III secretion system export apparatus protein [Dyella nitratireducens]GLQ43973.1 EscV/YscV/HrcV family type III secretion system export apparatus protein [Dyella nitratireducens]